MTKVFNSAIMTALLLYPLCWRAEPTFSLQVLMFSLLLPLTFAFFLPDMGGFVEGERSQTVSQGEGALIKAPQIHSFPRPQITWFRDGRKIPSSSRM